MLNIKCSVGSVAHIIVLLQLYANSSHSKLIITGLQRSPLIMICSPTSFSKKYGKMIWSVQNSRNLTLCALSRKAKLLYATDRVLVSDTKSIATYSFVDSHDIFIDFCVLTKPRCWSNAYWNWHFSPNRQSAYYIRVRYDSNKFPSSLFGIIKNKSGFILLHIVHS